MLLRYKNSKCVRKKIIYISINEKSIRRKGTRCSVHLYRNRRMILYILYIHRYIYIYIYIYIHGLRKSYSLFLLNFRANTKKYTCIVLKVFEAKRVYITINHSKYINIFIYIFKSASIFSNWFTMWHGINYDCIIFIYCIAY